MSDRIALRRLTAIGAALTVIALLVAGGAAAASRIFYLDARAGTCLIATSQAGSAGHKHVTVVPCTSPKHNFEVFAIRHGGWGKAPMPADAPTRVVRICRSAYRSVTGHPLRAPGGIYGFWPDAGTEQARYRDKVICSYILYPSFGALGSGRHLGAVLRAQTQTTISIRAQTSNEPVGGLVYVTAGKTAYISGATGDGQAGTEVQVEASTFPFTSPPATVAQTQTGTGGAYAFTVKPSLATRYFVELVSDPATRSSMITVYVSPNWTGHTSGSCSGVLTCHLRFSASVVYPLGVAGREGAKEVYYYFGVRYGSRTTPPSRIRLVGKGRQHRRGRRYHESFAVSFSTVQAYYYRWEICTKDTESKDGIGLPGHHHCGGRSITRAAFQKGYIG